jgi:serine/threonine-protein kinase
MPEPASPLDRLKAALAHRYVIERELGSGGMASVYLVDDLKYQRKVAMKVLRPELGVAVGAERFLREIQIAARYVMPYVEGESLRERLNREKQLPVEDTVQITREIGDALSYAHSRGVVHRDIKPENILLSPGGAILADFGVARALDAADTSALTATGIAIGTPAYMSPEQATGLPADARSDIYSLACVVYEMLGGEPPHTGPTPKAILARQLTSEVRPLAPIRPKLSPKIDDVLRRALDPTPADRYSSAVAFAEALAARKSGRLRASVEHMRGLRRRVPLAHVLIGVGAFLVIAVIIGLAVLRPLAVRASEGSADLLVFPFRESGTEASALGEGVPDLLIAALDGTVGIRVADPGSAWRRLRSGNDPLRVPELDEALALAEGMLASRVVLGSVTAAGGRVVVSARLYERDGSLRTTLRSSVAAESLGTAINRLALDIVVAVWERDSLPTVPMIEALATDDIEAMKAYLLARSLSYRGRYAEAEEAIGRAVQLDSTFALAHLEQFKSRSWVLFQNAQPYTGLREIIDRAMRHRGRLSVRNRLLVEAYRALDDTDGSSAASLFGRALEIDSLDLEARRGLA